MNAKTVQKYKKYSTPKLIEIAQRHFNKYIRLRDAERALLQANVKTDMIKESIKDESRELYKWQAESYTRIAEAYIKLAKLK